MTYLRPNGEWVFVPDAYQINIIPDIIDIAEAASINLQTGWFPQKPKYPSAIFYLLSSTLDDYISNKARRVTFIYYFEVRAFHEAQKEEMARNLCSALSLIYDARRSQYDDSFETSTGTYIKRVTFKFKVKLGE